ncbi:hypothetical protein VTN31DRAFT_2216 [Thermomyces dupontii]|uniref:uncharacterized protein n=1 Tax=Talaromyces thermophilus TaxID=28565 RepID=UPI003743BADD
MPAQSTATSSAPRKQTPKPVRAYLFVYNLVSLALWATCTLRGLLLLIKLTPPADNLPAIFHAIYSPLLAATQTLAGLEVLHSLVGFVRAPVTTTFMQVASRFLVVWGVMYPFHEGSLFVEFGEGIVGGDPAKGAKLGDYAFLGCLFAWGITECIRYGFFALQLGGFSVQKWWMWLRYNTFFVLYPAGISSECVLMWLGLDPAAKIHPLYRWFLISMLVIYVPGSYILYTHMMAQRRRVLRGKSRVD